MPFDCRFCGRPLDLPLGDECRDCRDANASRIERERPAREAMRDKMDRFFAERRAADEAEMQRLRYAGKRRESALAEEPKAPARLNPSEAA